MIYGTHTLPSKLRRLEHPGVKTLNIYKNRLLVFSTLQVLCIPHPNSLNIHSFCLSSIKTKKNIPDPGTGDNGMEVQCLGSEY